MELVIQRYAVRSREAREFFFFFFRYHLLFKVPMARVEVYDLVLI